MSDEHYFDRSAGIVYDDEDDDVVWDDELPKEPLGPKARLHSVDPATAELMLREGGMPHGQATTAFTELNPIEIEGDPAGDPARPADDAGFVQGGRTGRLETTSRLVESPRDRQQRLERGGQEFSRVGESASDVSVPTFGPVGAALAALRGERSDQTTYSADAAASGLADMMTLGFTDELAGAGAAARGEDYTTGRDVVRERTAQQVERNPGSYAAGAASGLPLMAATPGPAQLGAVRAAGPLARVGAAAAEGLTLGAAADIGGSEEEGLGSLRDIGPGAATGLVAGGALAGTAEGVPALARRLTSGRNLQHEANLRRIRSTFGADKPGDAALAQVYGPRRGQEARAERTLGEMREMGIRSTDDAAAVADRGVMRMEEAASGVDDAARAQSEIGTYRGVAQRELEALPARIAARVRAYAQERQMRRGSPANLAASLEAEAQRWESAAELGPMTFRRAWEHRQEMGGQAWRMSSTTGMNPATQHLRDLYRLVDEEMVGTAGRVAPDAAAQFREGAREYHRAIGLAEAGDIARRRSAGGRQVTLTDTIAAGAGAAAAGDATGVVGAMAASASGALVNRAVRTYEHAIAANAYETVGRLARTNPQALGQYAQAFGNAARRGPAALAALYFTTWQTDPAFRDEMRAIEDPDYQPENP